MAVDEWLLATVRRLSSMSQGLPHILISPPLRNDRVTAKRNDVKLQCPINATGFLHCSLEFWTCQGSAQFGTAGCLAPDNHFVRIVHVSKNPLILEAGLRSC